MINRRKRRDGTPSTCQVCGVSFIAKPGSFGMYCSRACFGVSCRKPPKPAKPPRDFWASVDRTGDCWLWTGATNRDGYGVFYHGLRNHMAHRWAWTAAGGALASGDVLMHKCDTPACVRPSHCIIGTHRDNQLDKVAKRRHAIGERVGNSRLTAADVRQIRASYRRQSKPAAKDGNSSELARQFGVCESLIRKVATGKLWSHVQ